MGNGALNKKKKKVTHLRRGIKINNYFNRKSIYIRFFPHRSFKKRKKKSVQNN